MTSIFRLSLSVLFIFSLTFSATATIATPFDNGTSPSRNLYVSVVQKGSVSRFIERMAIPQGQVVVTTQPVSGALESHTIEDYASPQTRLFVAEMTVPGLPKLPGEILRINRFAFLRANTTNYSQVVQLLYSRVVSLRPMEAAELSYPQYAGMNSALTSSMAGRSVTVDADFLKQKLAEFSGAQSTTIGGQNVTIAERGSVQGRNTARAYLAQEYTKLGFKVGLQTYKTGANFIAEKQGRDPSKVLVVSAHLDSVGNAGADDDGAGTISALGVAQALSKMDLNYTLRIVGFDQEEKGLVGSTNYARFLNANGQMSQLIGLINLEMTGYNNRRDGGFHSIDCRENTSATLTAALMKNISELSIPLKLVPACTDRSDHAVFWKYGVRAIVISENFFGGDSNPCYHKSCDTIQNINFQYMQNITHAAAATVADLVGAH